MEQTTQSQVIIRVTDRTATVNGQPVQVLPGQTVHQAAIAATIDLVREAGAPLTALAYDTTTSKRNRLIVHPNGLVEEIEEAAASSSDWALMSERPAPPAQQGWAPQPRPEAVAEGISHQSAAVVAPVTPQRVERTSFITAGRAVQPAANGWRGALNSLGLRLPPGEKEQSERGDIAAISRHWPGARTIAVVNAKGSASKTPTVACLAATLARQGGGGVLAWDNNETEGTLRFRTEWAHHEATLLDLLPHVDRLLSPSAAVAEMSAFVHHQPADKYDVLWSDTTVDGDHVASAADVDAIHQVAARYYRMILMDSGNNARAENWRAMIDRADALVVPCTEVEDTAEVGARLLEALHKRGGHSAELAANALVLVSQRTPQGANLGRIIKGFKPLARAVVHIPYDPALETGVIRYDNLSPESKRAWLRAAAALAEAL